MEKKGFLVIILIILVSSFLFATGNKEEKKQFITIKTSNIGGTTYAGGAAWAKLITDNSKFIATNVASPGGNLDTFSAMVDGEAHLALLAATGTYNAYIGKLEGYPNRIEVRALFGIWPGVYNIIVHEKSGVKDIYGLKGKNIATYVQGDPNGEVFDDLLAIHGITPQNTKIHKIMKNDATRMFVDENADCLIYAFGHGHSNLREMTASKKIKFIFGDFKHIDPWLKKYPFFSYETFGSEFGVEDNNQFVSPYFTVCMASMPEEQAYLFTKVWYENWDFLLDAMPANIQWINKENPMLGVPIPIHPGAEKYFKEIGLLK